MKRFVDVSCSMLVSLCVSCHVVMDGFLNLPSQRKVPYSLSFFPFIRISSFCYLDMDIKMEHWHRHNSSRRCQALDQRFPFLRPCRTSRDLCMAWLVSTPMLSCHKQSRPGIFESWGLDHQVSHRGSKHGSLLVRAPPHHPNTPVSIQRMRLRRSQEPLKKENYVTSFRLLPLCSGLTTGLGSNAPTREFYFESVDILLT